MSDRVVTVCGRGNGRDHFAWPYIPSDVPDPVAAGTVYPDVVDLDQAMTWFYRTRKWRLNASLTWRTRPTILDPWTNFSGMAQVDFTPNVTDDEGVTWFEPTRELDLFYLRSGVQVSGTDNGGGFTPVLTMVTVSGSSSTGFSAGSVFGAGIDFDNKQPYWSFGLFTFFFTGDFLVDFGTGEIVCSTLSPGTSVGALTVDGTTWSLTLYKATDTGTDLQQFLTCNASLNIQTYWAYATSGADPVYDTSTGSILNDPFS